MNIRIITSVLVDILVTMVLIIICGLRVVTYILFSFHATYFHGAALWLTI